MASSVPPIASPRVQVAPNITVPVKTYKEHFRFWSKIKERHPNHFSMLVGAAEEGTSCKELPAMLFWTLKDRPHLLDKEYKIHGIAKDVLLSSVVKENREGAYTLRNCTDIPYPSDPDQSKSSELNRYQSMSPRSLVSPYSANSPDNPYQGNLDHIGLKVSADTAEFLKMIREDLEEQELSLPNAERSESTTNA